MSEVVSQSDSVIPARLLQRLVTIGFFIGIGYMLLLMGAALLFNREFPVVFWTRTGIPVSWIGASYVYWRMMAPPRPTLRSLVSIAASVAKRHPGKTVWCTGMGIVIETLTFVPDEIELQAFYAGSVAVLLASIAARFIVKA